ncbi:MAG: MFS transporter, partial [Streptosporangiaceae bacterium]
GLVLFSAASLAGGFATGQAWLLTTRAVQGAGGAVIAPAALALIATTFPEGKPRNRAMGVYATMTVAGAVIGLIAGGLLVTYVSWRWVLFVNVPIGLAAALLAPRVLRESPRQPGRSDLHQRHLGPTRGRCQPGCISREQFETDTRGWGCAQHGYTWEHCPHGEDRCRHGYPAGVIPVPGDRHRPGPASRLFFATREAAEADLYRGERERAEPAAREAPSIKELRRAMADAHPDRGGTAEQFMEAGRRYQMARSRWP